MDLLVGGSSVGLVLVLALATLGTRSFESPSEADGLTLMLGDLDVMVSDEGGDGGVATVLVAVHECLIGLGIDTRRSPGQVTRSLLLLLAGDLLPLVALKGAVPAGRQHAQG